MDLIFISYIILIIFLSIRFQLEIILREKKLNFLNHFIYVKIGTINLRSRLFQVVFHNREITVEGVYSLSMHRIRLPPFLSFRES